jgi:peptidyl-prolyl cis-trans isomerase-like 3
MSVTLQTSLGDVKIEIACDLVPRAAFNFLALAASGAYENTTFHRNIKGFMIQGGDPTGTGKGGDSVWGGTFDDELCGELRHDRRGVVAMANKGPNTNRAQFFICYAKQPHLNSKYTIVGRVIDGFEVLDAMERVPVGAKDKPLTEIKIKHVHIHANPLAENGIVYPSPTAPLSRS